MARRESDGLQRSRTLKCCEDSMKSRSIALLLGLGSLVWASSANALIVNYDATNPGGTSVLLSAGTYTVQIIGTSAGGSYDAWDPWSNGTVSGCDGSDANCSQGWTDRFTISFGGQTTQYYLPNSSYFATEALALSAYTSNQLDQQTGGGPSSSAPNPITFTLGAPVVSP